jgi:two-component system, NtrC family, nitrogen regulation response regulator NtrX
MDCAHTVKSIVYLGCPAEERAESEKALAAGSLSIVWADSVASAIGELERRDMPVLLDLTSGPSVLRSAREIKSVRASTLMFAVVDARRPELTTEAVLAGMADVFARPLGGRRVANAIDRELAFETSAHTVGTAQPEPEDLYTHSLAMREVSAFISRAGAMRAGVMIRGEDGTGRRVVARAIHALQAEPAGPFVTLDCAAFDADELEARLFGTAEPAVGDATRSLERVNRGSLLDRANGGTLYLQNVADASARVQARLARILRDREAVAAETGASTGIDVRPMAGVDSGVDDTVREGRVREDLFRRLSVLRVEVPPLRNRRADIPPLANYFVREICARLSSPPKALSRSALSLIGALPWRGNAVELRALLESVAGGVNGSRRIGIDDVLAHLKLDGGSVVFTKGGTLRQARARFEREYIASVLELHRGRISEAARVLGIQRTNLYRKMRELRVGRIKTDTSPVGS